jgi:hypothetical protein
MDDVDIIHTVLREDFIILDKIGNSDGIFDQADAFVNLSRENDTVEDVYLRLSTDPDAHRYAIWDKIAEGIGNLQALRSISIYDRIDYDDEHTYVPDWEILACILRRLRRGVTIHMHNCAHDLWDALALQALARVIHGHAMITGFVTGNAFPLHCLDMLCSNLLTLPALENVSFEHDDDEVSEEVQFLESMVTLLQLPTLREVGFRSIDFTSTFCQAIAKALKERSEITNLHFMRCSFPEGGGAVIARALKTNTTLKDLYFDEQADESFCEVMAAALLSNSTLQTLSFSAPDSSGYNAGNCLWLSPLFLSLKVNSGLKDLRIDGIHLTDEKLSTAIRLGLGNNSTLETLNLSKIKSGKNDICLWQEALSFLPINTTLETLYMHFEQNVKGSHAIAIRTEVLAMLRDNESLETLFMPSYDARLEDYLLCIAAIQPNTTLKSLQLHDEDFCLEGDEMKYFIAVLMKNYGLEEIVYLHHDSENIRSIFDLNQAGRRYLVKDGSSISKGVAVLSRVSSNMNSVFLHLLENPRLCDRGAVEMSSSIGNMNNSATSTPSPGNHSGEKREQQSLPHTDTETRRRLE